MSEAVVKPQAPPCLDHHNKTSSKIGYFAIMIVIIVIVIIFLWWYYGVYSARYPAPSKPDADVSRLIGEFESYPKWLWFRNNPCKFDQWLKCRPYRFVVFESNGEVVYDSRQLKHQEPAEQLTRSVEYIRAASLTQGVVVRDYGSSNTVNLAELVKEGDRYRIVHISEYVYNSGDQEF